MKKTPLRTCIVTRESLPKGSLLRIVRNRNSEVFIDDSQTASGRGCYLKKDKSVISKAKANHSLEKALKCRVDESVYEDLLKRIGG